MARKQWDGTGKTNGAAATRANSNDTAGSAFDALEDLTVGDGTATYNSTNVPFAGWRWLRLLSTTGRQRAYHSWTATNQISERIAFRLGADPGVGQVIFSIVASDFSFPVQLQLVTVSGARHIVLSAGGQVRDFGAATFGTGSTATYWLQWCITKGTTTSNGQLKAKLYDSTQTLIGTEYTSTAVNTGTLQYIRTQRGGNTGANDIYVTGIDTNDTAPAAYVALPSTANAAPTGYMMDRPDPFEPGTVTVTGTLDDTDGTVASATVSIISGPNFPTVSVSTTGLNTSHCTVTATFTAQESARYLVRLGGTDNAGAAVVAASGKSLDVYIDTYATTGPVNVYQEVSAGSYTAVGAGTGYAAVTDSDDASYVESPSAPSAAQYRAEMCAYRINRPIKVNVTNYRNPSGGASITVTPKLYAHDNTTLIETGTPFAMSSSVGTTQVSFTAASLTTKASRRDLIVCLELTQ